MNRQADRGDRAGEGRERGEPEVVSHRPMGMEGSGRQPLVTVDLLRTRGKEACNKGCVMSYTLGEAL